MKTVYQYRSGNNAALMVADERLYRALTTRNIWVGDRPLRIEPHELVPLACSEFEVERLMKMFDSHDGHLFGNINIIELLRWSIEHELGDCA